MNIRATRRAIRIEYSLRIALQQPNDSSSNIPVIPAYAGTQRLYQEPR